MYVYSVGQFNEDDYTCFFFSISYHCNKITSNQLHFMNVIKIKINHFKKL